MSFLGLASCAHLHRSGPPPPKPIDLALSLSATSDANVCGEAAGNPVEVRVYRLDRAITLEGRKLREVWENGVLPAPDGGALLGSILLLPAQSKLVQYKSISRSSFVLVIAGFCNPTGDAWFFQAPATDLEGRRISLSAGRSQLARVEGSRR